MYKIKVCHNWHHISLQLTIQPKKKLMLQNKVRVMLPQTNLFFNQQKLEYHAIITLDNVMAIINIYMCVCVCTYISHYIIYIQGCPNVFNIKILWVYKIENYIYIFILSIFNLE